MTGAENGAIPMTAGGIVLLPPGVYATVNEPFKVAGGTTTCDAEVAPPARVGGKPVPEPSAAAMAAKRFDVQRRLRRALAAKEATMLQLTQTIMGCSNSGGVFNDSGKARSMGGPATSSNLRGAIEEPAAMTLPTVPSADATWDYFSALAASDVRHGDIDVLRRAHGNESPSAREEALLVEHEKLKKLVSDLQRELDASRSALRGKASQGSHLTGRRSKSSALAGMQHNLASGSPVNSLVGRKDADREAEAPAMLSDKLDDALKRVGALEELLAVEQRRREEAETRCAEIQVTTTRERSYTGTTDADVKAVYCGKVGGLRDEKALTDPNLDLTEQTSLLSLRPAVEDSPVRNKRRNSDVSHSRLIHGLVEKQRAERAAWSKCEKEFKHYIHLLESTLTRMERGLPAEDASSAGMFNMTVCIVACQKLLNRRNNGTLFIDPFVVLYSPTGEKTLETLPREDTDSPRFSETEDRATFKVARGSPWSIVFEVYSRGVNNERLFLGQAKVPIGPLLEEAATGRRIQQTVKLHPRDREAESDIQCHRHQLGSIIFTVSTVVVGRGWNDTAGDGVLFSHDSMTASGRGRRTPLDTKRRSFAGCDASGVSHVGQDTVDMHTRESPLPAVALRVHSAKGIIKRPSGVYSNPYVVAYDGDTGDEFIHTPSVVASSNPIWGHSSHASGILYYNRGKGHVVFRVYDHDQEGRDRFLGEAELDKQLIFSGKEWHELRLGPRVEESVEYIRRKQHRLGKLLVHCTRPNPSGGKCKENRDQPPPKRFQGLSTVGKVCGSAGSSAILNEECVTRCQAITLDNLPIQVSVEACSNLGVDHSDGQVAVCVVSPSMTEYCTPAVPQDPNPSWVGPSASARFTAHPLSDDGIQFRVVRYGDRSDSRGSTIARGQISVMDLFRRGFGRKVLRLESVLEDADLRSGHEAEEGATITVFFKLLTSHAAHDGAETVTTRKQIVEPPTTALSADQPSPPSKVEPSVVEPTTTVMSVYIKEAHELLDYDQNMFNVLGVTDPRVLVWIGPNHVFTAPVKQDTVNPKWTREEGEFQVSVRPEHIIRFEVQDVDATGFDGLGCATVHASEIVGSEGERKLPVMLDGKQYGTLTVVFAPAKGGRAGRG
uniref:Uncharacterized protein TCIL3000_10_4400 n=1 Tax=Trypanosoma congolense (strain IL3000) TaxID=1068625 RepID=G0UWB1_TRYCI|nr:unnamed protein product [Trypanosoma congolense IL3000]